MTDTEIYNGLGLCKNTNNLGALNCGYCPYNVYKQGAEIDICTSQLSADALQLLTRQKEQIKALKENRDRISKLFAEATSIIKNYDKIEII